jgi:hypothetical protein
MVFGYPDWMRRWFSPPQRMEGAADAKKTTSALVAGSFNAMPASAGLRVCRIALVGHPASGKSVLTNALYSHLCNSAQKLTVSLEGGGSTQGANAAADGTVATAHGTLQVLTFPVPADGDVPVELRDVKGVQPNNLNRPQDPTYVETFIKLALAGYFETGDRRHRNIDTTAALPAPGAAIQGLPTDAAATCVIIVVTAKALLSGDVSDAVLRVANKIKGVCAHGVQTNGHGEGDVRPLNYHLVVTCGDTVERSWFQMGLSPLDLVLQDKGRFAPLFEAARTQLGFENASDVTVLGWMMDAELKYNNKSDPRVVALRRIAEACAKESAVRCRAVAQPAGAAGGAAAAAAAANA